MNHVYRLCWNRTLRAWVPASELATNHGVAGPWPSRRRVPLARTALAMSLVLCGAAWAGDAPTGGQIVGGSGQITQSGETTTIRQQSNVLSLDWQGFDIGAGQTVNFLQPGRDAIAVNRILGNTASDIQGHLNANGQVWLINPNGVLFGQNAQVNVGGLVASTLDVDDSSIGSDSVRFAGNGRGSVVNRGSINVAPGGYAALLGNTVSNQGTIRAQLGTVALAGGTALTLTFSGTRLMHVVVDANAVKSLVENHQLIVANGGQVLMTAGARNALIASAVNNTGTVQARTVAEHDGVITLLSGMEAGTTNVAGTLDASAPDGGKGGFIETSGAQVQVADDARITTLAASGQHGTWLVDPTDFTIAASGGDITAATLQSQLASGNVTFTSAQGASGTAGNVNVNQAVSWSASTTLTLTASNNVNLNANITNTGASGKTVLNAGNAFVNNTGAGALGGNWEIYSANPAANTLGGLAPGFIQYSAPQGTAAAAGATGNGLFYSAAATFDITGFNGTPTKSYDGTGNLLVGNLAYALSGSGDTLKAITGGYSQSDVGTGLTVKAPTAISAYTILNGGTPVFGYTVSGANSASVTNGSITQANLTIGIVGSSVVPGANSLDKVYDGTNNATLNSDNYQISGLAPGEKITVNQPSQVGYGSISGNTITPTTDVDNTTTISAIFTNTNFVADSGTKLSNYNLTGLTATGIGYITPAPVYLSGIFTQNKTYDATISAPIDKSNASIFGIVNNDAVTLDASAGIGTFADANAGNGKAVTLSGFTLVATGGAKTSNYNLIVPANLTANIGQRGVDVYGLTVGNKVYDGSTATTAGELDLSGISFAGTQGTDSLKLDQTNVVGTFSQADVGNNLAVSVSGLVVQNSDGTANNNYVIGTVQGGTQAAPSALLANITPRALTIRFNGSADKIYDGTSYATLSTGNFIVTGMAGGEVVSVNQAPATYVGAAAPNVGTNQVTATLQSSDLNFSSGAKAGNYTFNTSVTGTGSITPAPLTLVLNGNPSKVYDGDSSATVNAGNFALYGAMPGENITLNGPFAASYYSGTAGAPGALESNVGNWLVQVALGTGNYGFTPSITNPSGSLGNYILPMLAIGYGSITPKAIGAQITAGITGASKVYDGNTSLTLGQSNIVFNGFVAGDSVTASVSTVTGTLADKNVGTQPLTALLDRTNTTFTCGGGGTACLSNYTYDATQPPGHTLNDAGWSITAYGSGEVTPKQLYITLNGATKQYNGNTTVLPLTNGNFTVYGYANNDTGGTQDSGWVAGEGSTITPTASFTYGSKDVSWAGGVVQSDIPVAGTLTWNNYAPNGSTDLRNYNLVYNVTGFGKITPAPLYVDGIYAQNKIYDGGTGALINITNGQIAGLADVDKNAAALTVNIGNSTASTADGIAGSTGGTLAANGAGFSASGSPASGTFGNMNVSAGQQNVSTAFSLSGSSAGNYTLAAPLLTAKITPRPLTVSGITANNKAYDGNTAATFTFGTPTLQPDNGATGTDVAGLLAQDSGVTLNQASGTGTFATANANADINGNLLNPSGSHITVTASGFTLSGDPNGNYALAQPSGLSADIKQKPITLALVGPISKVYDGSKSVTIPVGNNQSNGTSTGYQTSGWVAGEGATLTQTHSAAYADANATVDGSGNNISADGKVDITANLVSSDWQPGSGTMLSNYALPTTVTAHVGQITPLVLNLSATRIYDATTNIYASLSGNVSNGDNANVFGTLNGLNSDQFTVTGTGTTSSKNVGTYTNGADFGLGTLALAPISGNASNYTLVGGIDSYTITKAPLNINGGTVNTKVYDRTTAAAVTGASLATPNTKGGVLGSDVVTLVTDGGGNIAGTFNDMNAGTGKTVTINAGDVTGTDAGNYQIVQPPGLTGTISQRTVTIAGARQYNASSSIASGGPTWTLSQNGGSGVPADTGVISGDTVTVNSGSGSVASANVGTYNSDGSGSGTFTATGLGLSNSNYVIATTGNTFQITPYQINLTGSSTYDGTGTRSATGGSFTGVSTVDGSFSTGIGTEKLLLGSNYMLNNGGNVTPNGSGGGTAHKETNAAPTPGGGLGGLTLANGTGGTASNYVLNSVTYTVNPYVLSFTGSRSYDGTMSVDAADLRDATGGSATAGTSTFTGLNGDTFILGGNGTLSSANAGSYGGSAGGVSGTPGDASHIGVTGLSMTAMGANAATAKAGNYTFVGGNDTYTVNKAALVLNLVGARQYDGTGIAHAADFNGGVLNTNVPGETLTLTGSYDLVANGVPGASKDVGDYTWTYVGGFTLGDGAGGGKASNYTLNGGSGELTITEKVLDLSGTRVYDGGKAANASLFGTSGMLAGIAGETVQLTGSGLLSAKDVNGGTPYAGTGIAGATSGQGFNLGTLALANGTGKASNYTLVGGTDSLILTPKQIMGSVSAPSRVYDGTTTAMVSFTITIGDVIGGVIASDDVNVDVGSANFADKNAGNGKTVTASGITLSGTDAGNYTIAATATTTANIYQRVLDLSGTRVYDGTTVANAGNLAIVAGGLVPGETLGLSGAGVLSAKDVNGGTPYAGTGVAGATSGQGFNLGTLALTSGTGLASNYTLVGGSDSLTITPAVINLSGTRVYDQSTAADFSLFGHHDGTIDGVTVGGVTEVLGLKGSGALGSKNVNTYTRDPASTAAPAGATDFGLDTLALGDGTTGNGTTTSNGDLGNYTLIGGSDTLTITHKAITVDAAAANKVYDGTTTAGVVLGSTGVISGDTVNFASTDANFDDKNVGTGKTVTVDGISAGGTDAGNYTINTTAITTADITPYVLNLTGQRVYDTTAGADAKWFGNGDGTINGVTVGGVTEVLDLAGSGVSGSADVGTYARNPGSTTVPAAGSTDFGLGSLALGDNAGSLASNYTLVGGNDRFVITPAGVVLQLSIAGGRQYDGTTAALSSDFGKGGVITVLNGQTLNLTGQGTLTSANAGNYQTSDSSLLFGSIKLTDGTGKASNYTLTDGSFTVTQRVLGLSGTRVYDGSTNATASDITAITGLVTGETLGLTGTGVLSGKDVNGGTPYTGTGGAVGPQGFDLGTLALTNGAGGLASNYTLVGGSDALTITQRAISATFTGDNKVYDGTTVATVSGAALTQNGGIGVTAGTGLITGDKVTLTNPTQGSFADKNANTGITVTGDMGITGDDAGNYVFANGTATADITPKVLDLTGTRIYDTTTDAAAGDLKLGGLVGSETLVLGGQGGVTIKNVGSYTGGDFNLGSLGLADGSNGGLAGNYTLVGGTDTLTITPAPLTVSGITAASRTYDGTTAATVSGGTLHGVLGGDNVTLSVGGTGTFATPNAGTGIAVSVVTNLGGSDVGNYVLTSSGGAVADIYRKVLDLSGTRVYDGSTAADASDLAIIGGLVGSETLVLTGTGTLGDGNVGVAKPLAGLGTLALGNGGNGGLASNYTLAGGIDTLTITPYVLDLAGTRTYDGTTDADASSFGTDGMLAGLHGQTLQLTGTGSVADKNVGSDKPLTDLGTLALGDGTNGGLAGNYTLVGGIDTLTITPKTLTVVAVGTDKLYDGNTLDQVTLGTSDVLAGDSVQLRFGDARFSDPNIGRHKLVTVTGVQVGGADGGNYLLASPTVYTYADITGGQPAAFGIGAGTLAYLNSVVGPSQLATPYGSTTQDTVGTFNGNKQRRRQPVQRNGSRNDFTSGLALKVIDGGLRMPSTMAMP